METLWTESFFKRDMTIAPITYNKNTYNQASQSKSLRIGYFYDLASFESADCIKRAINECKTALEIQGHTLVEFIVPESDKVGLLFQSSFNLHGSQCIKDYLVGEAPQYYYQLLILLDENPILKHFFYAVFKLTGNERMCETLSVKTQSTPGEYIQFFRSIQNFKIQFTNY